jgi:hypothetical protein
MLMPAHIVRALAVESRRDPRSVINAINGKARGVVVLSVQEAAARLGIEMPHTRSSEPTHANGTRPDQERVPHAETETIRERESTSAPPVPQPAS